MGAEWKKGFCGYIGLTFGLAPKSSLNISFYPTYKQSPNYMHFKHYCSLPPKSFALYIILPETKTTTSSSQIFSLSTAGSSACNFQFPRSFATLHAALHGILSHLSFPPFTHPRRAANARNSLFYSVKSFVVLKISGR